MNRLNRRSIRRFTAAGVMAAVAAPSVALVMADRAAAATTCTYSVSGKVVTADNRLHFTDTFGHEDSTDVLSADAPLAGAKVRVSTSWSGLGIFDSWGTKTLGSDGSFSFSKTWSGLIDCGVTRDYKVDVSFDDSELTIGSAPWYTVKKDSGAARTAGTHNLGTLRFKSGGSNDAGSDDARIEAETWLVVHRAVDYLQSEGVPYTAKITVNNPNRTISGIVPDGLEGSYADPGGSMTAFIEEDSKTEVGTILHEIGHLWAYQHTSGETCLSDAWWEDFSVHDASEDPCVAFHEGFAAYFGDMLSWQLDQENLLNGSATYPASLTRWGLSNLSSEFTSTGTLPNLDNLADVQRSEFGWMQVFRVLDQKQLANKVFGTSSVDIGAFVESASTGSTSAGTGSVVTVVPGAVTCDSAPTLDLTDVLGVFGSSMDSSSPTVESLLSRADSKLTSFDSTDATNIKNLIDPAKTTEPSSMYC